MAFEACWQLNYFLPIPVGGHKRCACYQRMIIKIIKNEKLQGTYACIDNVRVCNHEKIDNDHNLKQFMATVEKYNLTLNHDDCSYRLNTIVTSKGTMVPDPEWLKLVWELSISNNNDLEQVMGIFTHYSPWVASFCEKI